VVIIGAGFSGLAAASLLAKEGNSVTVIEKNSQPGGRARQFESNGFVFDMGPSWYWMPEVFDQFYNQFGKKSSDFYSLRRVDPSYRVFFEDDSIDLPAGEEAVAAIFEKIERGSAEKLSTFLKQAKYKYQVGMQEFVWKPGDGLKEFIDIRVLKSVFKLQMFTSISREIKKLFSHPYIIQILEFPVLFLGAAPKHTPALFSLMNYADICLGTWYPMGGMHEISKAFEKIALDQGVKIKYNEEVIKMEATGSQLTKLISNRQSYEAHTYLSAADYQHVDQSLLPKDYSNYSADYWESRDMAPSSLLYYIGVNKKLPGLTHHNLFFDKDFNAHIDAIYKQAKWPEEPLFYACCPSKTDPSVAPEGMENLFLLIPLAPGLKDDEISRASCFENVMDRLSERIDINIREHIVYIKEYGVNDFKKDYHAFKGNAYGLANTLRQTAFLKPKIRHKKLKNLFFTGQLTTPGPGVPPSIISGQMVAKEIIKSYI
jgi:phytoene desaturase